MTDPTWLEAGQREIEALHAFFEAWMAGTAPADSFATFEAALAPEFTMVGPGGLRLDCAGTLAMVQGLHGGRGPEFRIWIEGVALLAARPRFVLMGYDECQLMAGQSTRRRATAAFEIVESARNGLLWLSVHETWVAAAS